MYLTKSGVFCSSFFLLCISEDIKKPLHLSFSSPRIAADLCALPLCPAYMGKAILTVGDKHLPNKTQASVGRGSGFMRRARSPLAAMSCLYTGEVAASHVSPALAAQPRRYTVCCCHPRTPSLLRAACDAPSDSLCILQMKVCAAANKERRGINQSGGVRRGICYSPVIPRPLSRAFLLSVHGCNPTPTWCLSQCLYQCCCPLPQRRFSVLDLSLSPSTSHKQTSVFLKERLSLIQKGKSEWQHPNDKALMH